MLAALQDEANKAATIPVMRNFMKFLFDFNYNLSQRNRILIDIRNAENRYSKLKNLFFLFL